MSGRAALRHLLAAERALDQVRRSMALAESRGVDLDAAWQPQEDLSLVLQAERFQAEDEVEDDE